MYGKSFTLGSILTVTFSFVCTAACRCVCMPVLGEPEVEAPIKVTKAATLESRSPPPREEERVSRSLPRDTPRGQQRSPEQLSPPAVSPRGSSMCCVCSQLESLCFISKFVCMHVCLCMYVNICIIHASQCLCVLLNIFFFRTTSFIQFQLISIIWCWTGMYGLSAFSLSHFTPLSVLYFLYAFRCTPI